MSGQSPTNPLWQAHVERLQRLVGAAADAPPGTTTRAASICDRDADAARSSEWIAAPLGKLGRRLLADIEPYLEFFAIARAG